MTAAAIKAAMGPREWGLLVTLSLVWGGSFFFVELLVGDLPPLTIVWLRVGLAALALWAFVLTLGRRPPAAPRVWGAFFVMGLINNVIPFSLIVWGQGHIASGLASILNATTPLFTVVVAGALLSDERMTAAKIAGVILGFAGTVVMIGPDLLAGLGDQVWAQLAILGAATSYAFAGTFGRRFKRLEIDPILTAAGQVTASAIILTPVVWWAEGFPAPADLAPGNWAALLGLALLSTSFAYVLFFKILESAGAANLSLVTFLVPVSAILLGVAFLGETLAPVHFAGMALIALGLAVIDGRVLRIFGL